jgi:hypothetical protein
MKANAFVLASVAVYALGASSATAGPCTTEIDSLAKVIASKDAGSGPTPGASAGTPTTGQPSSGHPPTAGHD